ncbi:MAG: RIP metalloprotease RseP [Firmicutes bacterium]|nr:RIP metalloprotease RseP [Bacillota bacterium]
MTIIYAIIIFCLLIFVHEFGHFFVAKACGIKVNEFAIGMGPAIFKKQRGETLYAVRVFPIGGYCAMEGEDEESEDERAFNNKPAWQRALVLFAGAGMNFITCVVLIIIVYLVAGTATTTIGTVSDDSPAAMAGIQAEDKILEIDGHEITSWNDVAASVPDEEGAEIIVKVERDGQVIELTSGVMYNEESQRYILGVTTKAEHNPVTAVKQGVKGTGTMTVMMYKLLKQLITGEVSTKDLSGPVGIVYAVSDSVSYGFINVVYLAALLSLNLAVINLLPFPALDGGRLLFLAIRKITGKAVTDRMEGLVHFFGLMCLFALMIYVTFNDVLKYILPIFS